MSGILYIAATPIGNLQDISRNLEHTLRMADFVACEDTRRTGILLNHLALSKPRIRLDEHAPEANLRKCVELLLQGQKGVYVSDAGTPGVSDPGPALVRAASAAGVQVLPIAGPAAVAVALSASGFQCRQFVFGGFLPRGEKKVKEYAQQWSLYGCPAVFFLSPHRVRAEINAFAQCFPDMKAVLFRELTKKFETHYRGTLTEISDMELSNKGEYTLVAEGAMPDPEENRIEERIVQLFAYGLRGKALVNLVVELTGAGKNQVYQDVRSYEEEHRSNES